MMRGARLVLLLAVLALCAALGTGEFHVGDFVPTARRGQFHGSRTHWLDLLGQYCPRFGKDRTVALPLPRPAGFYAGTDEYKMMLSFEGERHVSPWLLVMGKHAPEVPLVDVELVYSGSQIREVYTKVELVPKEYQKSHAVLVQEFANATHWPKHLLIRYRWNHVAELNVDRGLLVLFGFGLLLSSISIGSVFQEYSGKLTDFVEALIAEEDAHEVAAGRVGGGGKRD